MRAVLDEGRSFTTVLGDAESRVPSDARPRLRALCFEWARWATQVQALVDAKLDKPLRAKDLDVYLLMQLGVLEMTHMDLPAHTAVNECVKALKGLKRPWAKGLVNAVLRNTQRDPIDIESLEHAERYAYPQWWINHLSQDWPAEEDSVEPGKESQTLSHILDAGNQRAPMTLRVNRMVSSVEACLQLFDQQGLSANAHPYAPDALVLAEPVPVHQVPGFAEGRVSVQDAAAQMMVPLLSSAGVSPTRILDACSAPGGKAAYLAECFDTATVLALDHSADRLLRVDDTVRRLSLEERVTTRAHDAADLNGWWDNEAFDLVLLDAPCTGSGVIRRHPDIKHTRWEGDIDSLAEQQTNLLESLWTTVAPGGYLLYATCSIFRSENVSQVARFLTEHADASDATPAGMDWAYAQRVGYQVLPGDNDMDGFYYALIQKAVNG